MPEIKTWIIIVLIVFAWVQYTWPEKVQGIGDSTFGKLNEAIKVKASNTKDKVGEDICPEEYNPVCGQDGITYDNSCKAVLAGIFKATAGEC